MKLSRRSLLSTLLGAMVAPDPDKLLWRPGKKLISIPPTPKPVGREVIVRLKGTLAHEIVYTGDGLIIRASWNFPGETPPDHLIASIVTSYE